MQANIVSGHIAWAHAVSPPYIPFRLTRLVEQLQLIILWPQNHPPSHLGRQLRMGSVTAFGKLWDDPRMENMVGVICKWIHGGKEVGLGPQRNKLYEELEYCALNLLMNTP